MNMRRAIDTGETAEEKRRFREAEIRREHRLAMRAAIEASRAAEAQDESREGA